MNAMVIPLPPNLASTSRNLVFICVFFNVLQPKPHVGILALVPWQVTGKPSKAALLADRLSQYLGMTRALVGTDLGEIKQQVNLT